MKYTQPWKVPGSYGCPQFLFQFLDSMFSQLFELLKEVQECDTKVIPRHVVCLQYIKPRCAFLLSPLHVRFGLGTLGLEAWIHMCIYEVHV